MPLISSVLTFLAAHSHIWGCCHLKLDVTEHCTDSVVPQEILSASIWVRLKSNYECMVAHNYSFVFLTAHLSLF